MARAERRRRRKRRGTQSGRIETRRRGRPRNRAEARARARARTGDRRTRGPRQGPPTWRGAVNRGLIAAGIFFALLALLFGRPLGEAFALSAFMLAIYIPLGYYLDRFFYRLRQRRERRERERNATERGG